jgi:hypothetical protein
MGYCQVGGNTQSCTPEDCSEFDGHYFDKPGDFPGGCFLLSVLDDERAILMAGTMMYPAMIQFRDEVMRRTPLGRKLIGYFDEFYEEAKKVARKDPKLVTEVVWLATYVSPFIQTMLGQRVVPESPIETPLSRLASEYRPSTHAAFSSVVARFKARGSKKFAAALDDSEKIISRFVGLSPHEALRELRRPLPAAGKKRIKSK